VRARDASRVLRTPYTIHSEATAINGNVPIRCQYFASLDPVTKEPYQYTLAELAYRFGVPMAPDGQQVMPVEYSRETMRVGSAPNRRNGQIAAARFRCIDIETMERIMRGFPHGIRRRSMLSYARALRAAGIKRDEATKQTQAMALRCSPPYPSDPSDQPVKDIVSEAYSGKKIGRETNAFLIKLLGITHEIAISENLLTLKPESVLVMELKDAPLVLSTKDRAIARRAFVAEFVANNPNESARGIARAASANRHACDYKVIQRDLIALKIKPQESEKTLLDIFDI
jgi:hypothetical protein